MTARTAAEVRDNELFSAELELDQIVLLVNDMSGPLDSDLAAKLLPLLLTAASHIQNSRES